MNPPISLWLRESEAQIPRWPDAGTEAVDVLVVGAGLAGLATARALGARGRRVRILDRQAPGHGASGRSAGFFLQAHVTAYPALRRRVGRELAQHLLRLASENHAIVERELGRASGLDTEHRRAGNLMLSMASDRTGERDVLEEARALLAEDGVAAHFVEVPEGLRGFDGALFLENDGEIHPGKLVAALAFGLDGRTGRVLSIDPAGPAVVLEGGARIDCQTLVLATNAWTGSLLPELGITPHRAQMLSTAPAPKTLDLPCYAGFGFEYFRQRADGRVLLGGRRGLFEESEATDDGFPTDGVQRALEAYLHEHLPFAASAAIEARWAGTMGFSRDGLPLVGELGAGVHTVLGFTGHGLGIALACAEVLARALTSSSTDQDAVFLSAFAPRRALRAERLS